MIQNARQTGIFIWKILVFVIKMPAFMQIKSDIIDILLFSLMLKMNTDFKIFYKYIIILLFFSLKVLFPSG